jgi:hypothetical protein
MKEIFPPIILHKDILSKDECKSIERDFFSYLDREESVNDDLDNLENVYGINIGNKINAINIDEKISDRLSLIMENVYAKKLKYSHCYIRAYYKNSELPIHLDHAGLDITLSINIGGVENWPIYVSTIKNKTHINTGWFEDEVLIEKHKQEFLTFITPIGSGVSCCGKVFPHWRDKLLCGDDEYVLQIFFHWRLI